MHAACLPLCSGKVADYIPELAKVEPDLFGIALTTVDGQVYQTGDSVSPFTIQSISKPLTYGLVLGDLGVDKLRRYIGVEPTGDAFNAIRLEPATGRPMNPMINAGAIATAGLVAGGSPEERFARILSCFGRYAGHPLVMNESVYASERETGHRNRAIAHLLRNFDMLENEPEPHLDLYFRQCSVEVCCRDLSVMAATLANRGVNPITGVEVLKPAHVEKVLSVMATCGMYDASGNWIFEVGMPAKSGVGGGILAVLPGQFGLGVFSPRLDDQGNSVRGVEICRRMSQEFGLHMFHGLRSGASAVRARYDAAEINSRHDRPPGIAELIEALGRKIRVYELQGDMVFGTAEYVTRDVFGQLEHVEIVILDLRRVLAIDQAATRLLADLRAELDRRDRLLLFAGLPRHFRFERHLRECFGLPADARPHGFEDLDHALEWCEHRLLERHPETGPPGEAPLARQALCAGLKPEELAVLESKLARVRFSKGDTIVSEGSPAECLYFLGSGEVSVEIELGRNRRRRITRLHAGQAFGEMGILDKNVRSATVVAQTEVMCHALVFGSLDDLPPAQRERLRLILLRNLGRQLSRKLRRANQEIRALA